MMKFKVSITETYVSNVELCAFDAEDAVNQAMELFCDGPLDDSTIVALNVNTQPVDCLCDCNSYNDCPCEE